MNFDFLHEPLDPQTTYFVVFGSMAVYGLVMVLLMKWDERRNRSAQTPHK